MKFALEIHRNVCTTTRCQSLYETYFTETTSSQAGKVFFSTTYEDIKRFVVHSIIAWKFYYLLTSISIQLEFEERLLTMVLLHTRLRTVMRSLRTI